MRSPWGKQRTRSPLEQQVQRQKALYEQLQAKLKEVYLVETVTVSSWVAQEPSVALEKGFFSKSIPVILGMGAFLGVLLGGGLIVLLGSLEGKFQTWEEIGESLREKTYHYSAFYLYYKTQRQTARHYQLCR